MSVNKLGRFSVFSKVWKTKTWLANVWLSCALLSTSIILSACENNPNTATPNFSSSQIPTNLSAEQLEKLPSDASAHWLVPQLLLLPKTNDNLAYSLVKIAINSTQEKYTSLPLTKVELTDTAQAKSIMAKFPHLTDYRAYNVAITGEKAKLWLKQKLLVVAVDQQNKLKKIAYLQTAAILDQLYTSTNSDANEVTDLGATITQTGVSFKLWAPTAQAITLLLFNEDETPAQLASIKMVEDTATGIWQASGDVNLQSSYYQYQITLYHPASKAVETLITTDPYSLSLAINSKYSHVINLNDSSTQPKGWQIHTVPTVENIEDNIFYEIHIRDFSAYDPELSNPALRGK